MDAVCSCAARHAGKSLLVMPPDFIHKTHKTQNTGSKRILQDFKREGTT